MVMDSRRTEQQFTKYLCLLCNNQHPYPIDDRHLNTLNVATKRDSFGGGPFGIFSKFDQVCHFHFF